MSRDQILIESKFKDKIDRVATIKRKGLISKLTLHIELY